ncbi:MAG: dUTP diphosphatase [Actinomycetia bacterium]|nr:dUTP diphosphatase [Actinomycetes bacterium]
MKIPVTRKELMHPLPVFAHPGDAGADLTASEPVTLEPGERALVPTGLAIAIPTGFAGFVLPRSGLAVKSGITVINAPGLIDSGYRGELRVGLVNLGNSAFTISSGDRIAQLVIMAVLAPEFIEVDDLDDTHRGSDGFGSTGVTSP